MDQPSVGTSSLLDRRTLCSMVEPTSNLPEQPTPLIGREAQIHAICAQLREPHTRLITLTGAGGIGKTRLALAVAGVLADAFGDGVTVVELAAIRDPVMVLKAIAQAL